MPDNWGYLVIGVCFIPDISGTVAEEIVVQGLQFNVARIISGWICNAFSDFKARNKQEGSILSSQRCEN